MAEEMASNNCLYPVLVDLEPQAFPVVQQGSF